MGAKLRRNAHSAFTEIIRRSIVKEGNKKEEGFHPPTSSRSRYLAKFAKGRLAGFREDRAMETTRVPPSFFLLSFIPQIEYGGEKFTLHTP
jgi:hypothetical protein